MPRQSSKEGGKNSAPPENNEKAKLREIGQRIKQARVENGMRQGETAAHLDVTERTVQALEQGEIRQYKYLPRFEELFGKPTLWFLEGDAVFDVRDQQFTEILQRLGKIERALQKLARES
jgi:transcriptional regulator with XRE-family HTH domain